MKSEFTVKIDVIVFFLTNLSIIITLLVNIVYT